LEHRSFPIPLTLVLAVATYFYARGWFRLRRAFPNAISFGQFAAFVSGIITIWVAAGSPLSVLDHELLSFHMIQHILLMAVAPPLLLIGAPVLVFSHGLPDWFLQRRAGPFFRWAPGRSTGRILTHPIFCWLAATGTVIGWHIPFMFELGLHSHLWHEVQHTSFFATGLLFWWPVIRPWPSVSRWPTWSVPLYLFFATLPCDALSAFLTFSDRVVYRPYALQDQEWAGVLMWVCVTFIYMVPAVVLTVRALSPDACRMEAV
jgi:putative membrane protein